MLEKLTQSITHFDWAVAPDYRFEDSSKGRVIVPVWTQLRSREHVVFIGLLLNRSWLKTSQP